MGVPRVSGDIPSLVVPGLPVVPCSPRQRGYTARVFAPVCGRDVFPASAGIYRCQMTSLSAPSRVPRVSGDIPENDWLTKLLGECSLRQRGYTATNEPGVTLPEVFPASAGIYRWCQSGDG
ncbi:hypothetical protein KAB87_004201 [Salmonella enterica]|nr:hypothetical protein [Salmonella enterica]